MALLLPRAVQVRAPGARKTWGESATPQRLVAGFFGVVRARIAARKKAVAPRKHRVIRKCVELVSHARRLRQTLPMAASLRPP